METLQPRLRFPEFKGNWVEKIFKETCKLNPLNKKLPIEFYYIDLESVKDGLLNKENKISLHEAPSRAQRLLAKEDVLFQMVRPYQKNNYYFDKEGDYVASTGYAQLRAKYSSKFLFQYLHNQKFVDKVLEKCTGSNYPAINSNDLANIIVYYPDNHEQTKIANFLSSIDEKINLLKEKKELLEEYKKGIMQKIFNQEIRFKDDNGNDFENWKEFKLEDIAIINMGQSPNSDSYNSENIGLPLIQGNADIQNRVTLPRNWTSQPTKICEIGDLILTVRAPVGAVAKSNHKACIGRGVCTIKNNAKSTNEFIYQFFLDYETKWSAIEQGSTFQAVSGLEIKKIKLTIPCILEQTKIANFLSAIDDKIELVATQIQDTKEYKKGLLQQMFI
jgi:type I restriction enzyme S subunit